MAREGIAIQLSELYAKVRWIYPLLFDEIIYKSEPPLKEVMNKYPKVVHAISHAGTLGWIPVVLGLLRVAIEAGGHKRRAFGVFHRGLYRFWVSRMLLRYLFESEEPPTFAKVIEAFRDQPVNDIAILPEGDNCIVGDVYEIRPFRSPKFVELALATNAPILITVHRGAEEWGRDFYIPSYLFPLIKRFQPAYLYPLYKNPVLNLPTRITHIPKFSMRSLLYMPRLSYEDLSSKPRERWFQLQSEAQRVRTLMQDLLQDMPYL
jgi:hypothetical protein